MTNSRLGRVRNFFDHYGIDALLITNPHNRRYVSGFTGTSGYVLLTKKEAFFLTDFRYVTQAQQEAAGFQIVEHDPKPMVTVKETLRKLGIDNLGFEQQSVSYGQHQSMSGELAGITLNATDGLVERVRMIKDDEEIRIIQQACDLADATFKHILPYIKPGAVEQDIALEMEFYMRKNGATSTSFDTIVASGVRSALPHGRASEKKVGDGELVTLDFGAYYKGYCSDMTRTVHVGKPDPKAREIYDIVLEAQMATLAGLKPGMTGREADAIARDIIKKYGYGDYFGHGTGHSFGMEIHEAPRASKLDETVLAPGMTMTVEPGIYLPGFGGVRIEDDVVLTDNGIKILTHSDKSFIVLE